MARRRDKTWPGAGTGTSDYTLRTSGIGEPRQRKPNKEPESEGRGRRDRRARSRQFAGKGSMSYRHLDDALRSLVERYGQYVVATRLSAVCRKKTVPAARR